MLDFNTDIAIAALYASSGLKGNSIVWLFTDQQIINERMFIYVNDLLSSGFIPDPYTPDSRDNVLNAIRTEVKAAGLMDLPDMCWNFFLDFCTWCSACRLCATGAATSAASSPRASRPRSSTGSTRGRARRSSR